MGIYSIRSGKEWWEAWEKVRDRKTMSYIDYRKEYGLVEVNQVCSLYEGVGVLLQRKLIDVELVQDLFGSTVTSIWEKLKPLYKEEERRLGKPHVWKAVEYLYNEMQKREQRLQQTQQ